MECKTCGEQPCKCKIFVLEEDPRPADVFPLSAQEKAVILEFRSKSPKWLPPSGDLNDPNLGEHEKMLITKLRQHSQITFDEPVEHSAIGQGFGSDARFEQKFYCANCGLQLKSWENGNFELACDCGEEGKKYNFPLITQDENEHIRRTQSNSS